MKSFVVLREHIFRAFSVMRVMGLPHIRLAHAGSLWCEVFLSPEQEAALSHSGIPLSQ